MYKAVFVKQKSLRRCTGLWVYDSIRQKPVLFIIHICHNSDTTQRVLRQWMYQYFALVSSYFCLGLMLFYLLIFHILPNSRNNFIKVTTNIQAKHLMVIQNRSIKCKFSVILLLFCIPPKYLLLCTHVVSTSI